MNMIKIHKLRGLFPNSYCKFKSEVLRLFFPFFPILGKPKML